jgi:hypothetical protein
MSVGDRGVYSLFDLLTLALTSYVQFLLVFFSSFLFFLFKKARAKYLVRVKLTATNPPEKVALPKHLPFGVPAAKGIWTYEVGKEWKRYSPELNQQLEDNHRNGKKFFHIKIGGTDYSVNLVPPPSFPLTQFLFALPLFLFFFD